MNTTLKITGILLLLSITVNAQKFEITPQYGYQIGSKRNFNGGYFQIDDSSQYGLTLDVNLSTDMQAEFYWVQQNTGVYLTDIIYGEHESDVTINTYQFGAIHTFGYGKALPFIGLSGGWSTFNPDDSDFNSITTFTLGLSGGLKYFFSKNVGVRLQSQLLMPINYGGIYVGSGGSAISAGGSILQLNFSAGIILAFGS